MGKFGQQPGVEVERVCDCDDAFHLPPQQHVEARLKLRTIVLQIRDNWKKAHRAKMVLYASPDLCAIRVGEIKDNHAHCVGAFAAQRASVQVGSISQAPRHFPDLSAGPPRNASSAATIVQYHGNGSHGKAALTGNITYSYHSGLGLGIRARFSHEMPGF